MSKSPAKWPVWLLLSVWFCANCPPQATFDFFVLVRNGRHLSHQERLKADVANLLSGKRSNLAVALLKSTPALPPVVPIPSKQVLKKLDLHPMVAADAIGRPKQSFEYPGTFLIRPVNVRAEPLLTPPRDSESA